MLTRLARTVLLIASVLAAAATLVLAEPAPSDTNNLLKQAKEALKKQRFDEAIMFCTSALANEPANVEVLSRRAQAYAGAGKPAEALKDLDAAIKLEPANRANLLERARLQDAIGQPAAAIDDCTRALAWKKDASAFQMRGALYEKTGQLENAIADYSEVLKYQPFRPDLYVTRGKLYKALGQLQKAGVDFGQAVRLNPTYSVQVSRLASDTTGKQHVVKPTLAAVVPETKTAAPEIQKQPESKLVMVEKKADQPSAASVQPAPQQQPAIPTAPAPEPAPVQTAIAKAPEPAPASAPAFTDDTQAYNSIEQTARNQFIAKQYAEAVASFTKVIEMRPKLADGYTRRCAANYMAGNVKAALEDCGKAADMLSRDGDTYYYRGRAYLDQKDYTKAIESLTMAVEFKPYFPEAFFYRARATQAMDNLSQAIYGYSEAARQKQGYAEAIQARADIRLLLGDRTGYERDLELLKSVPAKK